MSFINSIKSFFKGIFFFLLMGIILVFNNFWWIIDMISGSDFDYIPEEEKKEKTKKPRKHSMRNSK